MIKKIFRKIDCFFGIHSWTSAVQEGIKATPEQLNNGSEGFFDYAKMYCKHCGKISDISYRHMK